MNQSMKMMEVVKRDYGLDYVEIERLGFNRTTIMGWLTGKHDPKVSAFQAFFDAMGLDYIEVYQKALDLGSN